MPKHESQAVPREVRQAVDEVTREILRVLADAGVDINQKNTKGNRKSFMEVLKHEGIELERTLVGDKPGQSGTRILKNGIQIGFVPALGVVAKDGKKVIV